METEAAIKVPWVPVASACRILRVSRQRVYQLADSGKLRACSIDGRKLIDLASIVALAEARRKKCRA